MKTLIKKLMPVLALLLTASVLPACGGGADSSGTSTAWPTGGYSVAAAYGSGWSLYGPATGTISKLEWDAKVTDHVSYLGTFNGAALTGTQAFGDKTFSLSLGGHVLKGTLDNPFNASNVTYDGQPAGLSFNGYQ